MKRRTADKTREAYKAIRETLKQNRENTRYFNFDFYKTFLECRRKAEENRKAGIDDSYTRPDEWFKRFHAWDAVYNSKFYTENSACYCQFLEIV